MSQYILNPRIIDAFLLQNYMCVVYATFYTNRKLLLKYIMYYPACSEPVVQCI